MKVDNGTLPGEQQKRLFFQRIALPSQTIRITLTDECNFKCKYCFREGEKSYLHKQTDADLVCNVVKSAKKFGVTRVKLTGGEPFLHNNIIPLLKKLRGIIDYIDIGTNGYYLDQFISVLAELPIDAITISLDTVNENIFESMCRVPGSTLIRVMSNINKAVDIGLPVKVNCVLTNENEDNIFDLITFCGERGINLRIIEPNNFKWTKNTSSSDSFKRVKQQILSNASEVVHSSYLPSTYVKLNTGEEISILECMCDGAHCDLCGKYMYLRFSIFNHLKPCLFREDTEVKVSSLNEVDIDSSFASAIAFMGIGPNDKRYDNFLKLFHGK